MRSNNYPWPQTPSEAQKAAVEKAAQAVLDVRAHFMGSAGVSPAVSGVPPETSSVNTSRRSKVSGGTPDTAPGTGALPKTSCTLADLYNPVAMPPALAKAHAELDRAVDRCYRKEPFPSDRARVEFLFQLYEQLTAPLIAAAKPKRVRKAAAYAKPPPAPSNPELTPEKSYGDSAHYYSGKEEPPPYRTD